MKNRLRKGIRPETYDVTAKNAGPREAFSAALLCQIQLKRFQDPLIRSQSYCVLTAGLSSAAPLSGPIPGSCGLGASLSSLEIDVRALRVRGGIRFAESAAER